MGTSFSSNALSGGVVNDIPSVSYAYGPSNTYLLGADATFAIFPGGGGEVTPFLVQPAPAAPTVTCSPILIDPILDQAPPPQSLSCPIAGTSLAPGLYTLSFSQYSSSYVSSDDTGYAVYTKADGPNTLTAIGNAYTYSFVAPTAPSATTTTTITPAVSATTTITSGISEVAATSTVDVLSATVTVTVYSSTVIKQSTTHTTLLGLSTVVTKTAACTMMKCNLDNCYRAMSNRPASASSFCSVYTQTTSLATPTYLSQCSGLASRVTSACTCFVTSTPKGSIYGPPDLTYRGGVAEATVTETAPSVTATSGPYPSGTTTDPNLTVALGTSTQTSIAKHATTTIVVSTITVDKRTTSTSTVQPTTCI